MAAPNLAGLTSVYGKTAYVALADTNAATVVNNAASSGKLLIVHALIACNVDGTNACDITVAYYTQDDIGGTAYKVASTISVPADSSIVIIDKNATINLEEDRSIGAQAGAGGDIEIVASYEEIA